MKTETKFDLARLPIDCAKGAGQLAVWPLHFTNTLATNAADTVFKILGTNTEDTPVEGTKIPAGTSVYDMARSNMDISAMIYYYTELRAEVKKLVVEFCKQKGISQEEDLPVLRGAVLLVDTKLEALSSTKKSTPEQSPGSSNKNSIAAVRDYQDALVQLEGLCRRFKMNKGDQEVVQAYFSILKQPKDMSSIYSDLVRYDKFIDPQFRFAFGGTEFNRKNVEAMITDDDDVFVHHIDDDFNTSSFDIDGVFMGVMSEMVWAIVVNKTEKKITVVFRGSTSLRDWVTNIHCNMSDCVLPGYTSDKTIGKGKFYGKVHEGFFRYLFGKTKEGRNGSTKSKGEEIVGMLRGLLDRPEYQGFSIAVTGHSLGGSLSTLFAFRCACQSDFGDDTMITNVSFASPFVGDDDFRKKFVDLERKRKIRHLRVSNYQDMVPLIPAVTFPFPHGLTPFKHVGMNIRLYDGGDLCAPSYRRFYPKQGDIVNGLRNTMHTNIPLGLSVGVIGKHLLPEYDSRLEHQDTKEALSKLSLDELYANKDITGWEYLP